jgi:hypothetical protein
MSLCWIPFFLRDPEVGVFTETFPIHLAIQLKEFSGIWTEMMTTWQHWYPRYPSDCCLKLESFNKSFVHDREYDEAYVEHLVE